MATIGLLTAFAMSCSKDKNNKTPTPNNPQPSNVIDESKLKAKWELTSFYTLKYDKTSGNVTEGTGISQTYHNNGVGQWNSLYTTYVTFNNDNSYDQSNADGSDVSPVVGQLWPKHGQWQLKNSNKAISFEIKPALGQTSITYDVVEFKDNYIHLTYKDTTTWSDAYDINHLEFKK